MSYVKRTLGPKETIRYETGYHWLYWAAGYLLAAPSLVAAFSGRPYWLSEYVFDIAALIPLPFALVMLVRAYAAEIVVTSERLIIKRGLISYRADEVSLDVIEEVRITETFVGRILGYGKLEVHGTGSANIVVSWVWRPEKLRHEIQDARAAFGNSADATALPKAA